MIHRVVCNVATDSWVPMQSRLLDGLHALGEQTLQWTDALPRNCPPHRVKGTMAARRQEDCREYAFKAYALKDASTLGYTSLLWCDACVIPVNSLEPIWERIETEGYWLCKNGYSNYQWTAEQAYPDLFPEYHTPGMYEPNNPAKCINHGIPHVVATVFGVSTAQELGAAFLDEYFRLASETRAFCGPWQNSNAPRMRGRNNQRTTGPCGSPDVLGHRHDQTAASVIAWRLGMKLDDPVWFSYEQTPETILWAKGEI